MKLSSSQIWVIESLQKGNRLMRPFSTSLAVLFRGRKKHFVHSRTLEFLIKHKIIEVRVPELDEYILTDAGKSIQLD